MPNPTTQQDVLDKFEKRYLKKKYLNLSVSIIIAILGISSFIYGLQLEPSITILRFMTVDGTLFTTIGALVFIIVNIVEAKKNTELTSIPVYFIRVSSSVAEMVILLVVVLSHLPVFTESIPIMDRYDLFVMHTVIPILTVVSFTVNDSPIGKIKPLKLWNGTWFVTFYAVIILSLIISRVIEGEMIPYFFLDVLNNPLWFTLFTFVVIYGIAYLMSWFLSEMNRKLSWLWYKRFF